MPDDYELEVEEAQFDGQGPWFVKVNDGHRVTMMEPNDADVLADAYEERRDIDTAGKLRRCAEKVRGLAARS